MLFASSTQTLVAIHHSQEAHQNNRPNENKYFQSRIIHNGTTGQKPPSVGYLGLV
jgi:hypothetical protein